MMSISEAQVILESLQEVDPHKFRELAWCIYVMSRRECPDLPLGGPAERDASAGHGAAVMPGQFGRNGGMKDSLQR